MREEVFKPFLRLDDARNIDEGGNGLGLAIARDIARSHGGDITLGDSLDGRFARDRARAGVAVSFARSFERRVAAAIARVISVASPSWPIRTSSAAAVVPPGEVTFWRSVAASLSDCSSNAPEPRTVSRASLVARSAGRPDGDAGAWQVLRRAGRRRPALSRTLP